MAMLTDSAEGWSQGRFCSTQDHPEPSTQGGRAKQKSRPTVAVRVPLSMELGPISAPELWRVTLRKSPAQARGQFTQFTPKLPLAIPYLVFEALLQHPKWLEGWPPLRPWCSPCLPPVLTGQLLAGCFGEGEAGEFHLHCEVTAWWGSWDVRDSDTCVVWVTASTQESVSGAVTRPPSCPSQGLVALSATPTGNSVCLTSGLSLWDRWDIKRQKLLLLLELSSERKKIRIPGHLSCPLLLAPLLPGEFWEAKKKKKKRSK